MNRLVWIVFVVALAYPLYVLVMAFAQTRLIFPGASLRHRAEVIRAPAGGERVEVPVSFGHALGVYWPPVGASAPAIWFAHGNAETATNSFERLQPLVQQGFAVFVMEFPGYADADGSPTFASVTEATDATWDWLAARPEVDATRMIAMGYSIGGGAAAELTRRKSVNALVQVGS